MNYYNPYQPIQSIQPMDQLAQLRQQQFQSQFPPQYPQAQQTQASNIVWVRSEMEARNYLVAPNNSVTMWNENGLEIYLKKADASGRPDFEVYDVIKRTASQPVPAQATNPNDEIITLGKLMNVLNNLGLMPGKFTKEAKEESVNE